MWPPTLERRIDPDDFDELIDCLNDADVDNADVIQMLIDDGAYGAHISFKYKKPGKRARRRKVVVMQIEGASLGAMDGYDVKVSKGFTELKESAYVCYR